MKFFHIQIWVPLYVTIFPHSTSRLQPFLSDFFSSIHLNLIKLSHFNLNSFTIALDGDALRFYFLVFSLYRESHVIYAFWRTNFAVNGKKSVNNSLVTFCANLNLDSECEKNCYKKYFCVGLCRMAKTCLITFFRVVIAAIYMCILHLCRTAPKSMKKHLKIASLSINEFWYQYWASLDDETIQLELFVLLSRDQLKTRFFY